MRDCLFSKYHMLTYGRHPSASWRHCWYVRDTCQCQASHFLLWRRDSYAMLQPAILPWTPMNSVRSRHPVITTRTPVTVVGFFVFFDIQSLNFCFCPVTSTKLFVAEIHWQRSSPSKHIFIYCGHLTSKWLSVADMFIQSSIKAYTCAVVI